MAEILLSYVVATRNKRKYLEVLLESLFPHLGDDEELIVVDGASTDGTPGYLAALERSGRRLDWISEPDHCQAHACNKGILRARGQVIKVLTDDDVYHFPSIRICRDYLLAHPEIDLLCGETVDARDDGTGVAFTVRPMLTEFLRWRDEEGPAFWFGDQGVFIRRSSLPVVGLWHTGVWCIDVELSMRITSLRQARLAWSSAVVACSVINPGSLSVSAFALEGNNREVGRVMRFYREVAYQRRLMRDPEFARKERERAEPPRRSPVREFLRPRTRARAFLQALRRPPAPVAPASVRPAPEPRPIDATADTAASAVFREWLDRRASEGVPLFHEP